MDARRLNIVLAVVALVATGTALALALRPAPPAPALPAPAAPVADEDVDAQPRAPGAPNAIAAKALEAGGPRAPTVGSDAGGAQRGLAAFETALDAGALAGSVPTALADCLRHAGAHAFTRLGADGVAPIDPVVAGACTGSGPDRLEGRVRVATRPAADGATACEASVSYTLTRADGRTSRQEARGTAITGARDAACEASVDSLAAALVARIGG